MIRALLVSLNQDTREGAAELIQSWRQDKDSFLWLDFQKELTAKDNQLLEDLGCHPLALQDAQRKRHPPKAEDFGSNTFALFRGINSIEDKLLLSHQQISFFIGNNFLVTLHRGHSISIEHFFSEARDIELISNPWLLASKIMHFASGRYLETILDFEDALSEAEDTMLKNGSDDLMRELVTYRSRLRKLKRVFNYHEKLARELMEIQSDASSVIEHALRDLYDRCERLNSLSDMYYEICGDLIDGYLSITSHQLNNTMKILTIITAIFVPLSFLAGLYGMNFDHIPELHYRYGYFVVLGVMFSIVAVMLYLFRRFRWF
ncbi:MAG: magnesium transporter CorA family protein [Pseudomonadales bacterium]|jgi:magnesium transporter